MYNLILENKPGECLYIPLNDLMNGRKFDGSVEVIDNFTSNHTKLSLTALLVDLNLIDNDFIKEGKYFIKGPGKSKYKVLFSDSLGEYDVVLDISDNIQDKIFINKLYNKVVGLMSVIDENYVKDLKKMLDDNPSKHVTAVISHIYNMPYVQRRMMIFYLFDEYFKNMRLEKNMKKEKKVENFAN